MLLTASDETQTAVDSASGAGWDSGALPRGTEVGRYVVLDRLGAGGMGVVYAAFDPELDRKVALKLLYGRDSEEARARLTREAQALARLTHPNVITVYDVGSHGDAVFVAMELVVGCTWTKWSRATKHSWREILAIGVAAGRGLAAAHAAGLVHRDFKPDNVMVGDDGRVRVMDFGLARGVVDRRTDDPDAEDPASTSGSLDSQLTRAGARMGTPAYMAPEQHMGLPTDARTDQFGFCVALYEALYGERPFRADSLTGLALAVTEGEVAPAPSGSGVPTWIRSVVVRGLAVDPADRHADMLALLDALERDPFRLARRVVLSVAAGSAVLGLFWMARMEPGDLRCREAEGRLAGVWDDDVQSAVGDAFAQTKLRFASASFDRTRAELDAYAGDWVTMYTETCEATHLRGEQSAELLDLRMTCLSARLAEFRALTARLQTADATVVELAPQLLSELGSIARCGDIEALRAPLPPPDDPDARERIVAVRERLAEARVAAGTGDWERGRSLSEEATAEARAIDYAPVLGEALLVLAESQRRAGDPKAAQAVLSEAFVVAAAGRRDDLVADAWLEQLYLTGDHDQLPKEALRFVSVAESAIVRAGDGPALRAAFNEASAMLHELAGDNGQAREHYELALATLEAEHGPDDLRVATVLSNLGDVHRKLGEPDVARTRLDRAMQIAEGSLGPDHPALATFLGGLARLDADAGDTAAAEQKWQRALDLREHVLGPDHLELAITLVNLANIAIQGGEHQRALAYAKRAEQIREGHFPKGHPRVVSLHGLQARAHFALGDMAAAEAFFALAVDGADAAGRPADPGYLNGLGTCRMALGRPAQAVGAFERAIELSGTGSDGAPNESLLAIRRFALAKALVESKGDRTRARGLAREARAALERAGPKSEADVREIDEWIAAND